MPVESKTFNDRVQDRNKMHKTILQIRKRYPYFYVVFFPKDKSFKQ